ncbi:hypothetical protein GQ55_8G253700 [Panicum hallii var. hallii]|uniref:Ubiquitin-like protease family profile domain-containing protein n=1 Tax=Panicum hallii var. hallii TaxID=1504633 RepID=A0A2T7CR43_9POAL|nr:hypothetical protein GQ55_8G253700 [Panicum hallii var. hallii]
MAVYKYKYRQPMLVGQNLNDAGGYVLKLHEWYLDESKRKEENEFNVTFYYRRKTGQSNLHSTTTVKDNKLRFVVNYWDKLFYSQDSLTSITVVPDEMSRLFNFGEMGFNLLRSYELFLINECENSGKNHVAFLEPFFIMDDKKNELKSIPDEDAEGYITAAIRKFKDNKAFIMIPFYERAHWILVVIVPEYRSVWYLNSKRDFNTSTTMFDLIARAYKNVAGIKLTRINKKTGNEECGFYVCYHMRLLSELQRQEAIIDDVPLTKHRMDTVRAGICQMIYDAANVKAKK